MAAAARPPGIGDARVPCPLCGGLIHPVAGRCKHCKEDLTAFRAGRPQAQAVLPALNGRPTPVPAAAGGTSVHAPATNGSEYAPPVAAVAGESSAPILPQRTTARQLAQRAPRGNLLRNWPVLVIILALIAIATAVVIMVMPADKAGSGGTRQLMPAPAPERMDTMPDQNPSDHWNVPDDPGTHGSIVPRGTLPGPQPRATPTPVPDDPLSDPFAPNDPDDMFGALGGGNLNSAMILSLAGRACKKLESCSNIDPSMLTIACEHLGRVPTPPIPNNCDAAQRCLSAIDNLDCTATGATANPLSIVMLMQDCMRAASQC